MIFRNAYTLQYVATTLTYLAVLLCDRGAVEKVAGTFAALVQVVAGLHGWAADNLKDTSIDPSKNEMITSNGGQG